MFEEVECLANALLYEGYLLYPYRASAVKNQQRWTFGCLLPPGYPQVQGSAEGPTMQTECLLHGGSLSQVAIKARFLHLVTDNQPGPTWRASVEREVVTPRLGLVQLAGQSHNSSFVFPDTRQIEPADDTNGSGERPHQTLTGTLDVSVEQVGGDLFKLCVQLQNHTPLVNGGQMAREDVLAWSFVSSHLLLGVEQGEFLSTIDPPEGARALVESCRHIGAWPVLVGDKDRRDTMIAAPIVLDDFPRIAEQSSGDFFDGTEIDEMLTLRIRTLTPEEKQAMAALDPRAAKLLERSETLTDEELLGLHGAWRCEEEALLASEKCGAGDLRLGMRVRLRPLGNADLFDLALAGMTAMIVSIDQDFEDRVYVSVALDEDPGKDLGLAGKPGHRFYFRPEEVERLAPDERSDAPAREAER